MRILPTIITTSLLTMLFSSCFQHYYTTHSLKPMNASDVTMLQEKGKQVFIHFQDLTMKAEGIGYNDGLVEGKLSPLFENKEPEPVVTHASGLHQGNYSNMDKVTAQVHVFTRQVLRPDDDKLVLPLEDIREIQYQSYDTGTSTLSHVAGFATIVLAIMVTAGGMIALSGGVTGPLSLNNLGL